MLWDGMGWLCWSLLQRIWCIIRRSGWVDCCMLCKAAGGSSDTQPQHNNELAASIPKRFKHVARGLGETMHHRQYHIKQKKHPSPPSEESVAL